MRLKDWQDQGQYFEFQGDRIFYATAGTGEPLLLLHAYPTASWGFHKIWPALTQQFQVITLDLLGSGFSDKPAGGRYSIFHLADSVEALLATLGIQQLHILAHAYGVTTAQELLARYVDRQPDPIPAIRSICFVNGGLFPEATRPTRTQKLLLTPMGATIARMTPYPYRVFCEKLSPNFGVNTQPTDLELEEFWHLLTLQDGQKRVPEVLAYLKERTQYRDRWVNCLQTAQIPLCLINGAADRVSGTEVPKVWKQLLPDAGLVQLDPTIGHYPPLEAPDSVFAAFTNFIHKQPF